MALAPLSEREAALYRYLRDHLQARGYPPSQREAAERCSVSRTRARQLLEQLQAKGYLVQDAHEARGLRLAIIADADLPLRGRPAPAMVLVCPRCGARREVDTASLLRVTDVIREWRLAHDLCARALRQDARPVADANARPREES